MRLSPEQRRLRTRAQLMGLVCGGFAGLFGGGFAVQFCYLINDGPGNWWVAIDRWSETKTKALVGAALFGLIGAAIGGRLAERHAARRVSLWFPVLLSAIAFGIGACVGIQLAEKFGQSMEIKYATVAGLSVAFDVYLGASLFRVLFNRDCNSAG